MERGVPLVCGTRIKEHEEHQRLHHPLSKTLQWNVTRRWATPPDEPSGRRKNTIQPLCTRQKPKHICGMVSSTSGIRNRNMVFSMRHIHGRVKMEVCRCTCLRTSMQENKMFDDIVSFVIPKLSMHHCPTMPRTRTCCGQMWAIWSASAQCSRAKVARCRAVSDPSALLSLARESGENRFNPWRQWSQNPDSVFDTVARDVSRSPRQIKCEQISGMGAFHSVLLHQQPKERSRSGSARVSSLRKCVSISDTSPRETKN